MTRSLAQHTDNIEENTGEWDSDSFQWIMGGLWQKKKKKKVWKFSHYMWEIEDNNEQVH